MYRGKKIKTLFKDLKKIQKLRIPNFSKFPNFLFFRKHLNFQTSNLTHFKIFFKK